MNNNKNNRKEKSKPAEVRAAISALLDAGETPTAISKTLNVARATVYRIKKTGQDPGAPNIRQKKKTILTPRVLGGLRKRIRCVPTKSLCRVADEAGVNRETVRKNGAEFGQEKPAS